MNIQAARFNRPKFLISVLAVAVLVVATLAIAMTGSAQAQTPNNTDNPPQPCGPGAGTAFMEEPHEITTGHFYLFDAYWQDTTGGQSVGENTGVLHTNLCPPKVVTTTKTEGRKTETVTSLTDSGLDIDEAIIHVLDTYKATVVSGAATGAQISTAEYDELDKYASAGDAVWWLRLDDPDTKHHNEKSDLALGFSTVRFSDEDWATEDGSAAFIYKFEFVRYPGSDSGEHPEFLAYNAPLADDGQLQPVWDSANAGVGTLTMTPGQLEYLQWVFTKPGTYEISAQLVGYVRQRGSPPSGVGKEWMPISENETESSEVKRYVIHVGDTLVEEEPPLFGFNLSVPENSAAGTEVSDPISVFQAESGELEYSLSGEGSDQFALVMDTSTNPRTVQIVVANGAHLDYEAKRIYDLTLNVTDNVDHESNPDPTIDDVLAVRITLEDIPTTAVIHVSNPNPVAGDTVTFTAKLTDFGEGQTLFYEFASENRHGIATGYSSYQLRHNGHFVDVVTLNVSYHLVPGDVNSDVVEIDAEPVTVTWTDPNS